MSRLPSVLIKHDASLESRTVLYSHTDFKTLSVSDVQAIIARRQMIRAARAAVREEQRRRRRERLGLSAPESQPPRERWYTVPESPDATGAPDYVTTPRSLVANLTIVAPKSSTEGSPVLIHLRYHYSYMTLTDERREESELISSIPAAISAGDSPLPLIFKEHLTERFKKKPNDPLSRLIGWRLEILVIAHGPLDIRLNSCTLWVSTPWQTRKRFRRALFVHANPRVPFRMTGRALRFWKRYAGIRPERRQLVPRKPLRLKHNTVVTAGLWHSSDGSSAVVPLNVEDLKDGKWNAIALIVRLTIFKVTPEASGEATFRLRLPQWMIDLGLRREMRLRALGIPDPLIRNLALPRIQTRRAAGTGMDVETERQLKEEGKGKERATEPEIPIPPSVLGTVIPIISEEEIYQDGDLITLGIPRTGTAVAFHEIKIRTLSGIRSFKPLLGTPEWNHVADIVLERSQLNIGFLVSVKLLYSHSSPLSKLGIDDLRGMIRGEEQKKADILEMIGAQTQIKGEIMQEL